VTQTAADVATRVTTARPRTAFGVMAILSLTTRG
jgi:hypothetical protein